MTDVQDMSLAEWAATSDGHRVLCSAARDALSRESAFATAALGSLARLAPLMAASTAGVVARRIDLDMRLSSAWDDGDRIDPAAGGTGSVELRLPDLVLIALMAAALIWGWHTWRR